MPWHDNNGNIFKLAQDYLSAVSRPLSKMCGNCESPALFKANGTSFSFRGAQCPARCLPGYATPRIVRDVPYAGRSGSKTRRVYRRIDEEETRDANNDGIPDVHQA